MSSTRGGVVFIIPHPIGRYVYFQKKLNLEECSNFHPVDVKKEFHPSDNSIVNGLTVALGGNNFQEKTRKFCHWTIDTVKKTMISEVTSKKDGWKLILIRMHHCKSIYMLFSFQKQKAKGHHTSTCPMLPREDYNSILYKRDRETFYHLLLWLY